MKLTKAKGGCSLLVLTAAQSFLASGAIAQEQQTPQAGIADIVVTAQRRAENVQDVPIAVAAFTGEQLQERGVGNVAQLSNATPNVTLSPSGQIVSSPSSLSGFIRGIGQDEFSVQFEPGVGTYIDGVYLARTVGANVNLLDIGRIEVLKGPQGTLFGRNTIGGAISIVTRDPEDKLGARLQGTYGRFNRVDVGGVVDIPIVADRLLSSIALNYSRRDGFQKRIPFPGIDAYYVEPITAFNSTGAILGTGKSDRQGGGNELNGRMKLLFRASDSLKITLAADFTRANQEISSNKLIATDPTSPFAGLYNACIGLPPAVLDSIGLGAACGPRVGPGTALAGVNVDGDPTNDRIPYDDRFLTDSIDTTYATGNNYSRLRNYGVAGTIDVNLTDDIALKSITAYRKQKWNIGLDMDGSPAIIFEATIVQDQDQFSQEIQLSGQALDDRLNWLVGGYYFKENAFESQNPVFAGGAFPYASPAHFESQALAAFTHLNFKLNDMFSITLGGRYTKEIKHLSAANIDLNRILQKLLGLPDAAYPDPTDTRQLIPTDRQRLSATNFSPRIGVEFKPVEDVMLYGSFSKGYKSGGWTTRATAPLMAVPTFDEEVATTFEVGLKSQFLDGKAQLNLAAFTTDYKGIQLSIQRGVSPNIENAGDARIKGFEAELQLALSRAFRLNASVGYLDAKFTSVDDPTGAFTLDTILPRAPKWTAHVGPEYEIDLGSTGSLTLRADYSYRSRVANDAENTPLLFAQAINLVDASVTYQAADERWSLSVGGRNIFNERYLLNGTNQLPGVGPLNGIYNQPGEWYVTVRTRF